MDPVMDDMESLDLKQKHKDEFLKFCGFEK